MGVEKKMLFKQTNIGKSQPTFQTRFLHHFMYAGVALMLFEVTGVSSVVFAFM
jgi:hypothetical protein